MTNLQPCDNEPCLMHIKEDGGMCQFKCRKWVFNVPKKQPKPQKNCMCDKYTNCTDCQQHDTTIRNAATLAENKRVLDAIEKFKTEAWQRHDPCDGGFTKFYQSLRIQEHP